jgi:hypothetical protein
MTIETTLTIPDNLTVVRGLYIYQSLDQVDGTYYYNGPEGCEYSAFIPDNKTFPTVVNDERGFSYIRVSTDQEVLNNFWRWNDKGKN